MPARSRYEIPWVLGTMACIVLLYLTPLFEAYLFADEMSYYRSRGFLETIRDVSQYVGRPGAGLVMAVFDDALLLGEAGLRALRLVSLAMSLLAAAASWALLRRLDIPPPRAALLLVFLWSQPALAVYHAYLSLMPYWLGVYCALASFAIFHARAATPMTFREGMLHGALFIAALGTFQATAFFVLPFLAYHSLISHRQGVVSRCVFLLLALATATVVYTAGFKVMTSLGLGGYGPAQSLMSLDDLSYFVGPGYLGIFEFWNYAIPLDLGTGTKRQVMAFVALSTGFLILAAALTDIMRDAARAANWSIAMACLLASFVPIAAAGGDPRQHLAIAAVPTLTLIAYRSAVLIIDSLVARNARAVRGAFGIGAAAIVGVVALGSAAGVYRGIVAPYALHFQFTRAALAEGGHEIVRLTVMVPPEGYAWCRVEPCSGFFGRRIPGEWHITREAFYRFVALHSGRNTDFDIVFLAAEQAAGEPIEGVSLDWTDIDLDDLGAASYID